VGCRVHTLALIVWGMGDATVDFSICNFFGLCCVALGFSVTAVEAQQKRGVRQPPSVVVDIVREKDVSQAFNFIGRVEAENSADIRARVQGVLESRSFTDGQTVEKGQRLFTIELPTLDNNLYAQIGLVMLIGLASESAILIVEFAKTWREAGLGIEEAALEAAKLRFRAVMMTALSFILGVMPLLFASGAGAARRVAMELVVFWGMVSASFIGLLFVPVLYVVFQRMCERFSKNSAS
jgi:hypothetical protein